MRRGISGEVKSRYNFFLLMYEFPGEGRKAGVHYTGHGIGNANGHFFQWHLIWRNYVTIYCRAIKNRKANTSNNSSEHENEDRRCAIVLFGIVMIFLVSNIPRIVLNAYEFFVLSSECIIVPFWVYVMTSINGLCLTFNSSFNFFVYCFVNPR